MRGYFDDEEAERKDRGRDTEVTLSTGAVIGVLLGLLVLCGLCFVIGYAVGHHGGAAPAASTQTAAPDQEPLQANGTIPKPSAVAQAPLPQPAAGTDGATPDAGASSGTPAQNGPGNGQPGSNGGTAQPQVKPAIPETAGTSPPSQSESQNVRPAMAGGAVPLMVQIAAVSHQEDADVLIGALRKRGYAVTAQHEAMDGLIHVRIGPFTNRDDANQMCKKLLNDGYNAVVQP